MTLVVAVADAGADRDLVAAALALAGAAGWEARAVHVREAGAPEPGSAELPGLDLLLVDGEPLDVLAGLAADESVEALAVGLRPGQEETGRGPGGVAGELLRRARRPLLLVRPGMRLFERLRRVLVPLEGSPTSSEAMRAADDAFCRRGREIVMLHVLTSAPPGERGSLAGPRLVDQEHYDIPAWQDEFRLRFSQCPEGGRHRVLLRVGDPAATIAAEAREGAADLLVVQFNGSFEGGRGAVVRELIAAAPCPLLVVPSGAGG